jgi:acetyl esterase/lipase
MKYSLVIDSTRPTLSADYRAFEYMLRMRPITDHDPLADPITVLKKIRPTASMSNVVPKPSHCQVHKEILHHDGHNVDAYWVNYTTNNFQRQFDKLILFLHGGGYVLGDVHSE